MTVRLRRSVTSSAAVGRSKRRPSWSCPGVGAAIDQGACRRFHGCGRAPNRCLPRPNACSRIGRRRRQADRGSRLSAQRAGRTLRRHDRDIGPSADAASECRAAAIGAAQWRASPHPASVAGWQWQRQRPRKRQRLERAHVRAGRRTVSARRRRPPSHAAAGTGRALPLSGARRIPARLRRRRATSPATGTTRPTAPSLRGAAPGRAILSIRN